MPDSGLPFDDIRALLPLMPEVSDHAEAAVRERQAEVTKPPGSLGRLDELVAFLGAWQDKAQPTINHPQVCVFVANHGVVAQGVSAYPPSVTRAMLENFAAGGAAVNQICATYGIGLKVFELALDIPTADITTHAAMDEVACAATIAFGMEAVAGDIDLLGLGEMGIGNTTVAAAIFAALYGGSGADWVGRGTGVDESGLRRKVEAVDAALSLHEGHFKDPLEVLRRLGGREVAARSSPRGCSGCRSCWTVSWCARRRRSCNGWSPPRSIIAWPATCRRSRRTARCSATSARCRSSISGCGSARGRARRWRWARSRRRSRAPVTWRPSRRPAWHGRTSSAHERVGSRRRVGIARTRPRLACRQAVAGTDLPCRVSIAMGPSARSRSVALVSDATARRP